MPSSFDTDFALAGEAIDAACAEAIVHYPAGDLAAPETIDAIVDRGNLASMLGGLAKSGGGVGQGEGADFDTRDGVKLRQNAQLHIDVSVNVSESSGTTQKTASLFEFDEYRWRCVRLMSRVGGKQLFLVTRTEKITQRRVSR